MSDDKPAIERLDVEDEEARFQRIQSTLEKLNAPSSSPAALSPPFNPPTQRPEPHPVPESELLARIRAFLPALEASNVELAQRAQNDPSSVDIEHVDDGAEQYIEMNLGLGLFEQRGSRPEGDSEDESMSTSSASSSSDSEDVSTDSDTDDSDSSSRAADSPARCRSEPPT
ncbi:putative protein with domain of unknown function (DUF4598) [Lyophyllum shimeji]|uniref:Uncharacterized protein n=1 Tax=Lyophyllum shimeji TaxID=47721 RepID=A0A9P3Q051_LYOSH|nr:putative protein with domain of unknown function (DUF4598) [Lyophyllum shimeji]